MISTALVSRQELQHATLYVTYTLSLELTTEMAGYSLDVTLQ